MKIMRGTPRYYAIKAAIRASVAKECAEAAKSDPRFKEAAEYWGAAAIYYLAMMFKEMADNMRVREFAENDPREG